MAFAWGGTASADDSVTDGTRTLTVSKSVDLSGDGDTILVTGSGYDESKGIYVGLCVITSPDEQPSPCGGGIDREGATGASEWISSNPPSYAIGLPIPYEPGGSFSVELSVTPSINEVVDCRAVACAIVTKNDHTIISDRSQDLIIPVTFTGVAPSTTTRPPAESTTPSETAPEITVADGVSDLAEVATSEGESDSSAIVVIVAAVLIVSVAVIAVRRRSKSNLR
ncbi:MAG: hypothetical protein O3C62_02820 [Actinomycetota bacterium]|nr:hypothetical protein [Actinomycetota bacterium]MDA3000598.1 hypothetical protein [Actinomycetota bacterium]